MQLLSVGELVLRALRHGKGLSEVSTVDIKWNGTSLASMPN